MTIETVSLNRSHEGAQGVYLMFPPDVKTRDFIAYQKQITDAFAAAIEKNGVKFAVSLSSIGADKPDKSGPILGLRNLEERLNRISGLNVLHLRAAAPPAQTRLRHARSIRLPGKPGVPALPSLSLCTAFLSPLLVGLLDRHRSCHSDRPRKVGPWLERVHERSPPRRTTPCVI